MHELINSLQQIASRASKQIESITTEEATKNALIMPFINALGYNVFDPLEVIPEFTADHGVKKGEKVDYAIVREGKPTILVECKTVGSELSLKHASQLFRYFSVTEARFAILTNGLDYLFFTDIEAPNKMDEKPFFDFNLLRLDEPTVARIHKFSKSTFDIDNILSDASQLKYTKQIMGLIEKEYENPSDEFVRYFTVQVISGKFSASVKEQFTPLVKSAFREFIKSKINARIMTAMEGMDDHEEKPGASDPNEDVITSDEEMEAYHIVRAIMTKHVPAKRIAIRDTKSYCGVLLDDNNRKPICRLHFNSSTKYLGLFDAAKVEKRIPIETPDDIYKHEVELVATLNYYL